MERKEAIEVVKKNYPHVNVSGSQFETALRTLIPELKESEGERTRKEILDYIIKDSESLYDVQQYGKERFEKWIAWLEKQGEQNTNEIHPIFRVGDYIKNKKTSDKVLIEQLDIATKAYCYVSYDGGAEIHSDFSFSKQDEWMLIGQNIVEQKNAWSKEDKRMLNLIIQDYEAASRSFCGHQEKLNWLKSLRDRVQLKQEWSEDDIKNLNRISTILVDASEVKNWWKEYRLIEREEMIKLTDFLKSLKERVQPQPKQEWSEEDETVRNDIIAKLAILKSRAVDGGAEKEICEMEINWLKSLRHRSQWKPSEVQMEVLLGEANAWTKGCPKQEILESLYNDLKKLKG